MGLFYWIFNVLTPLTLLIYSSLLHLKQHNTLPYGKWTVIIITLYLMDWISWIFQQSYIVYFIDLTIKILISFLPLQINTLLERQISNLHLQILFNKVRIRLINLICSIYIQLTQYLLSKMQANQSQYFKLTLCKQLEVTKNQSIKYLQFNTKQNSNILNQTTTKNLIFQQLNNINKDEQQIQSENSKIQKRKLEQNNQLNLQNQKYTYLSNQQKLTNLNIPQSSSKYYSKTTFKNDMTITQQDPTYNLTVLKQFKDQAALYQQQSKKRQILNQSQTSSAYRNFEKPAKQNISNDDFLNFNFKGELIENIKIDAFNENIKEKSLKGNIVRQLNQFSPSQQENFYQSQPYSNQKILQSKVEVILQIGTGTMARLEIYNIELYSNRNLRILSLYQREFQTHKLQAIKSLTNGYYQLIFQNGKIHSRKCKFRGGNLQPFFKYLI